MEEIIDIDGKDVTDEPVADINKETSDPVNAAVDSDENTDDAEEVKDGE